MNSGEIISIEVLIVAVPETSGSALYGMLDVLLSAGNLWQTLMRSEDEQHPSVYASFPVTANFFPATAAVGRVPPNAPR